jgi:hypothetical protein
VTKLRGLIKAKAEAMNLCDENPNADEYLQRKRKGMKHSTKAKNPDGESEREIKQ